MKTTRRNFLASATGALAFPALANAIPELVRPNEPRIKLGLAAYSLRSVMRHFKGKESDGAGRMEMTDFLDYCAKTGFDAAELTAYFFKTPVETGDLNGLKRQAHLLGVDLSGGAIGNNFSFAPSDEKTKEQLQYTRDWIDHYADLGIPVIRVFGGNPGKGISEDDAVKNIIANMEVALEHAAKRGVMLGIENHDFLTHTERLMTIVKALESPWFGVNLDSGNLANTPDPYADLEKLAPYAVNAQIKVEIPVNGKKEPADMARLIKILKGVNYGGYAVLEYEAKEDPFEAIPKYRDELRKALG